MTRCIASCCSRIGKVLLAGIFKTFNQTRRVGIARLFGDGTVDTSFMDTAYNQFAGRGDPLLGSGCGSAQLHFCHGAAARRQHSYCRQLSAGRRRRRPRHDQQPAEFHPAHRRCDPRPRQHRASSIQNYSANQTDETLFIEMTRLNGHLGPAAVTVKPVTYPTNNGTAGIAIEGQDFAFDSATYGTPTWLVSYPGITWHLGDGSFGQNNGYRPDGGSQHHRGTTGRTMCSSVSLTTRM